MATWQDKVAGERAKRDASLRKVDPKIEGMPDDLPVNSRGLPAVILTEREIEITESYTVTQLLAVLRERTISVEEVTRAFLRRAAVAHLAVSWRPPTRNSERGTDNHTRQTASQSCYGTRQSLGRNISTPCRNRRVPCSACLSQPKSTMARLVLESSVTRPASA